MGLDEFKEYLSVIDSYCKNGSKINVTIDNIKIELDKTGVLTPKITKEIKDKQKKDAENKLKPQDIIDAFSGGIEEFKL